MKRRQEWVETTRESGDLPEQGCRDVGGSSCQSPYLQAVRNTALIRRNWWSGARGRSLRCREARDSNKCQYGSQNDEPEPGQLRLGLAWWLPPAHVCHPSVLMRGEFRYPRWEPTVHRRPDAPGLSLWEDHPWMLAVHSVGRRLRNRPRPSPDGSLKNSQEC